MLSTPVEVDLDNQPVLSSARTNTTTAGIDESTMGITTQKKLLTATAICVIVCAWSIPALAKTMVIDMAESEAIKTLTVWVYPNRPTLLYFPHNVEEVYANHSQSGIEINHVNATVGVILRPQSHGGTVTFVTEKWRIGVEFKVADTPKDAVVQVAFRDVDLALSIGRDLYYRPVMEPTDYETRGDGLMHIELGATRSLRRDLYSQIEIRATGPAPLRLALNHVGAFANGEAIPRARLLLLDPMIEYLNNEAIVVLSPGETKSGVLWLPEVGDPYPTPLELELRDADGHQQRTLVHEWGISKPSAPISEAVADRLFLDHIRDANEVEGPIEDLWDDSYNALKVRVALLAYRSDDGMISFEIANDGAFMFPLDEIEVQDRHGGNHTKLVRADGRDQLAGSIAPGETLRISALFNNPLMLKRNGLVLKLKPTSGAPATIDVLEARGRKANKGRKTVLITAGGGMFSLDRGDDGSTLTSAYGLGGQYVYGAGGQWSADIGLHLLTSGEADIAAVARSERHYRLHGGLRYLFGISGWIPYARAGIGAALVSQRDGDDTTFDGRFYFQGGAGVIRWLSDAFVLGADIIAEASAGDSFFVFTGNAYFGFAWGGNQF